MQPPTSGVRSTEQDITRMPYCTATISLHELHIIIVETSTLIVLLGFTIGVTETGIPMLLLEFMYNYPTDANNCIA